MLKIEFKTSYAAFDPTDKGATETARILRLIANQIEWDKQKDNSGVIMDYNGNKVGSWSYKYDGIDLPLEIDYDLDELGYQGDREEVDETIIEDLVFQKLNQEFGYTPQSFDLIPKEEYQDGKFITTYYTISDINWGY